MRLLGYFGILALVPFNVLGFVYAFRERDLRGIGLMLFMAALLTFFAVVLRRGAKVEHGSSKERLAAGWGGESVTSFFAQVVAKSLEGRIFIAGALACAALAILALTLPGAVAISPAKASGYAVLFGMWPVVSFVWYVKVCGPHYESSIIKVLLTLAGALFPFYVAYARSAA
jgi:hypothetical protein